MSQIDCVTAGDRPISHTSRTNKGVGVGSAFKSYCECEDLGGVAAVACNRLADRQAADLARVGEGCDLGLVDHNRSAVTRVGGDVAIS